MPTTLLLPLLAIAPPVIVFAGRGMDTDVVAVNPPGSGWSQACNKVAGGCALMSPRSTFARLPNPCNKVAGGFPPFVGGPMMAPSSASLLPNPCNKVAGGFPLVRA